MHGQKNIKRFID